MTTTKQTDGAQWLTPREAADRLQVHESTIIRNIQSGKLAGDKVFGRYRVPAQAVEALLDPAPARESA